MHAPPSPTASRLQRLARYLQEDPGNLALLAEACEAAIACGEHEQALAYLATAERLAPAAPDWRLRRAHLCLATGELAQAAELLEALRAACGPDPVLLHDLAHVRLLQGDARACHALLQPWMEPDEATSGMTREQRAMLQLSWLRACHRLDRLEEGWAWARREQAAGTLHPAAAGAASLMAADLEQYDAARPLAQAALAADADQPEALVALGSIALAARDPVQARQHLQRALERSPGDARIAALLGFAGLLARDLPSARTHLEQATQLLPDQAETWQALGWTRLLQRERDAATAAFRTALALDGEEEGGASHATLGLRLAASAADEDLDRLVREVLAR
jgi:tetratricopeptide (TPR) repeat protein